MRRLLLCTLLSALGCSGGNEVLLPQFEGAVVSVEPVTTTGQGSISIQVSGSWYGFGFAQTAFYQTASGILVLCVKCPLLPGGQLCQDIPLLELVSEPKPPADAQAQH